jgi:hypothetical protein
MLPHLQRRLTFYGISCQFGEMRAYRLCYRGEPRRALGTWHPLQGFCISGPEALSERVRLGCGNSSREGQQADSRSAEDRLQTQSASPQALTPRAQQLQPGLEASLAPRQIITRTTLPHEEPALALCPFSRTSSCSQGFYTVCQDAGPASATNKTSSTMFLSNRD